MDLSMKTKTELKHVIAKIFHDLGELLDLLSLQISSEHTYSQNRIFSSSVDRKGWVPNKLAIRSTLKLFRCDF